MNVSRKLHPMARAIILTLRRLEMRIVVTTPTGNIGSKLTPVLLDRGAEVTVIARHPDKVKDVQERGAKVIAGDHSNAKIVQTAVEGADALFFLIPPPYTSHDPIGDYRHFGEAAAKAVAGNPKLHVVLLSSVGANRPDGTGLIKGLHHAENALRPVAKNLTILRANYFMENVLSSLPEIMKDGNIYALVTGSVSMPQVATADIANVAADVLLKPQSGHRVVDVVGPEDLKFDQVAQMVGTAIGKKVNHATVPPESMAPALVGAGFSQEVAREFVEMEQSFEKNLAHDLKGDEQRRGTITFQQFLRETFLPAYQQARGAAA
jgi:uncharacterized protein YbjT (DUF2867 family)